MEKCRNCGGIINGEFCATCGQKHNPGRIILADLAKDSLSHFFNIEAPIFRTLAGLSIRPGKTIREYIFGKRKKYSHPFRLFILILALYLLTKSFLDFDPIQTYNQAFGIKEAASANISTPKASNFFSEHINSFMLIFVATMALFSRLFFRKSGFYIGEYLALSFYTISFYLFASIFIMAGSMINPKVFILNYLVVFLYPVYVLVSFHEGNVVWRILKSLIVLLLAWPLYAVLGFFLSGLIVSLFGL